MKQTPSGKRGVSRIAGAVLAGLMLATANGATGAEKAAPADFYVAVSGKDSNDGTAAAPLATLAKARDAVREKVKAGLTRDIVVQIRGGTYPVTETLIFGPEDSGTEKFSITYAAAPGEKVLLNGGRAITGWKKGANDVWTTEIPDVKAGKWYPRQLFVNGQRAIRARTPNNGWGEGKPLQAIKAYPLTPAGVNEDGTDQNIVIRVNTAGGKGIFGFHREFEYNQAKFEGGIANWGNTGDIELVSLSHNEGGRKALQSVDPAAQTVTLRPPHRWGPKCYGNDWFNSVPAGRCYLENALEFLDSPGEWYLDRKTGMLSYWPRPGEDLPRCEVMAPVVQTRMLYVEGTGERPIVNLHFRGLHVEHVDWPLPPQGYTGMFCCNVPVFREGNPPSHRPVEAAVEMAYARSCSFNDGGIARVGGMGLVLEEGTTDIAVEGNHIQQTGASGIQMGERNVAYGWPKAAPSPRPGDYERFRIRNNHIHHCGMDYYGANGISLFRTKDAIVSHNLIHDIAYCGVVFAGDQNPQWNFEGGNTLERNHIYRAMQVTQDGGGFYASFAHAGGKNIVRANLIHDTSSNPMSAGVCLDGSSGLTFDHNVVYRNPTWTLVAFRPVDLSGNAWKGNLFIPTREDGTSSVKPKTLFDGRRGWELTPAKEGATPPEEFVEAMTAYAGLEPAYRTALQGIAPNPCDLDVSDDGTTWQFDFAKQGKGVVYRNDVQAGKGAVPRAAEGKGVTLKLRKLDAAAKYTLKIYAGQIQPTPTDSSAGDFTKGALFPMAHKIGPAPDLGLPDTMTGLELMEKGLPLKDATGVIWVAYRKTKP